MRNYLKQELLQESQRRMDFNDLHYRYLPANLKYLLEEPPIKYDIFPKHLVLDSQDE